MTTLGWKGNWRGIQPAGDIHHRSREVVRPTGGIVRGKFPSRKNGRMIHHEGLLERDAIYHFETSPAIVRYREQTATVHYADGPRLRRYTPDFEVKLTSGFVVLVEIKPEAKLADPDTSHKYRCIADHFTRSGQAFRIVTDAPLRAQPRLRNLRTIYHRASRAPASVDSLSVAANRLRDALPTSLFQVEALLGSNVITPYCLLLAGHLNCDLTQLITADTIVRATEDFDHAAFLSQKELGL